MSPYSQVPQYVQALLEPLTPQGLPWGRVDIQIKHLGAAAMASMAGYRMSGPVCWRFPCGCRPSIGRVLPHSDQPLRVAGLSENGVIYLDPTFAENFETASGLALVAHEMVHQEQFAEIPDFEHVYEQAQRGVPKDRPFNNIYEKPAYMAERDVYCYLLNNRPDIPVGNWVPLGVSQWGC